MAGPYDPEGGNLICTGDDADQIDAQRREKELASVTTQRNERFGAAFGRYASTSDSRIATETEPALIRFPGFPAVICAPALPSVLFCRRSDSTDGKAGARMKEEDRLSAKPEGIDGLRLFGHRDVVGLMASKPSDSLSDTQLC